MSQENTYLVILAILLCSLNIFMGPLAFQIAKMFGRLTPSDAREDAKENDGEEMQKGGDLPVSTPMPPGIHSRSGEYLRVGSFPEENVQISKYR
jgi:hypothetical protein